MHKCLRIDEVLENIFEAVLVQTEHRKTKLDRRSLLSILQTCRSFTGPATRLLWRDIYNIAPLILMMPEDLWEVETLEEGASKYTPRTIAFKRDVVPSDWERFDAYAPLVRHLGVIERDEKSSANFMVLHDNICEELEQRASVLLPNLSTMVVSSNDLPVAPLLLISQVRKVKVHMHTSQIEPLYRLLQVDIPLQGSQIKTLHLTKSVSWDALNQFLLLPAFSELLSELDLEEFECDWYHLTNTMLERLIKMTSLRSMTIFKNMPSLYEVLKRHPVAQPSLKRVTIWTDGLGPADLAHTLQLLRPTRLEEFWILPVCGIKVFDSASLKQFISAIVTFCSPDHFTHLGLEGGGGTLQMLSVPTFVDYATIRPLFAFSNLRELTLAAYAFDLTDVEVKELTMAWPCLQELVVDVESADPTFKPRTTLRSLLWFATYCRQLQSLNFQFSGIGSFSTEELALASQHQIRELAVGNSTISDPEKVASFMSILFPHLVLFYWTFGGEDDPITDMWREVEMKMQR